MRDLHRIYLAGPLFSKMERMRNARVRDALTPFAEVFLPQEDGSLLTELVERGLNITVAKKAVFEKDILALDHCDCLLLIMDGRTIDEGACFELGYAFARGKRCVRIKTDSRSLLSIGDNPMVECALERIFSSDEAAVHWIAEKLGVC